MPRITETLKQEIDSAANCYDKQNDRIASISLYLSNARALVEIADSLKSIDSHLAEIATALRTPDRTTLEKQPAVRSAPKKGT